MDSLSQFRTIDELVKMLDREKTLFRDMFERRKSLAYRKDFAMEIVEYKRERLQFLIDHGVIHENGDFLELEDIYMQFFEDVLTMNEEISIASVRDYIESLNENMNYYLEETNDSRKFEYYCNVRKILRRIGLRTLKNIVDLKHNVDFAYKQEPSYKIKKTKLKKLDEKRENIKSLIFECEKLIDGEVLFFSKAGDPEMQRTCMDVRNDFTKANHNLLEIERQIIIYINQIEQQNAFYKKLRRLKYLKDQLTWREDTNVTGILKRNNPVWMEKRPYNRIFLSIDMLRNSEEAYTIIRKIGAQANIKRLGRTEADPIDEEFLDNNTETVSGININEMWNAFQAQGKDLFNFILNFNYKLPRSLREHIILFCQMATSFSDCLEFTDNYESFDNIEYTLIYANQHPKNI